MRNRPNKNWIKSIFVVSKSCSYCGMNFSPWEELWIDTGQKLSVCVNCWYKAPDGEWSSHTYNMSDEFNTYYEIENKQAFESFVWEKVF